MMKILCKTGDKCPKDGYWLQIETGNIDWAEKGDEFPGYLERVSMIENGAEIVNENLHLAHYKFQEKNY